MTCALWGTYSLITTNPAVPQNLSTKIITQVNEVSSQKMRDFTLHQSSPRTANVRLSFASLENLSLFKIASLTLKEKGLLNERRKSFPNTSFSVLAMKYMKAKLHLMWKVSGTPHLSHGHGRAQWFYSPESAMESRWGDLLFVIRGERQKPRVSLKHIRASLMPFKNPLSEKLYVF